MTGRGHKGSLHGKGNVFFLAAGYKVVQLRENDGWAERVNRQSTEDF